MQLASKHEVKRVSDGVGCVTGLVTSDEPVSDEVDGEALAPGRGRGHQTPIRTMVGPGPSPKCQLALERRLADQKR